MMQENTAKRFPRGWDWNSLLRSAVPAPLPEGWGTQAPGSGRSAGPGWRGWRGWQGGHTAARGTKFPDKKVNSYQEGMAVPWKWGLLRWQELLARASEFGDLLGLGARGPGPVAMSMCLLYSQGHEGLLPKTPELLHVFVKQVGYLPFHRREN